MFDEKMLLTLLQEGKSQEEITKNFAASLSSAFNSWTELELARKEKEKFEREKVQKVKECIEILANYYKTYHNIDFDPVGEDEWEDFAKALDEAADMFKLVMRSPAEPVASFDVEDCGLKATVSTKVGDGEWTTKTLSAAEADKILKDFINKAF